MRLKDTWKPKVDYRARGHRTQAFSSGPDRDALREQETRGLDGRVIDADVHLGQGHKRVHVRLVGVQGSNGYGVFLTNLPRRSGPRQVADRSRVRWEVERSIRLDQSVNRLDALAAEQPCTLQTLWHASLIVSTIAALRAHTHHVKTRPPPPGGPRTEAPLHPRRLALQLGVSCQSMAQAFKLKGAEAIQRWNTIAEVRTQSGKDPNWRRRPSVLDQLRGWKRQPLARKKPNSGDVSHGHVKAAA